jgi:hypothetical protein
VARQLPFIWVLLILFWVLLRAVSVLASVSSNFFTQLHHPHVSITFFKPNCIPPGVHLLVLCLPLMPVRMRMLGHYIHYLHLQQTTMLPKTGQYDFHRCPCLDPNAVLIPMQGGISIAVRLPIRGSIHRSMHSAQRSRGRPYSRNNHNALLLCRPPLTLPPLSCRAHTIVFFHTIALAAEVFV